MRISPTASLTASPTVVPTAPVAVPPSPSAVPPIAKVDPADAERTLVERMSAPKTIEQIRTLSLEPRVWKSPAHAKAVDLVAQQMRDSGWTVSITEHKASWGGGVLRNVVAERRGTAPDGERGLVIAGAHLDSVSRAPGANDNASGSATLLELGRAFQGIDTRNDLRFLWFDGEEAGLLGSRAYVKDNEADVKRALAMVNMDMIGSQKGDIGFSVGAKTTTGLGDAMKGVAARIGVNAVFRDERHTRSDHASFDAAGVPALDFGVSVRNVAKEDPDYHSPRDTIDKINPQVLEGYGDLIAAGLLDLANRDARVPGPAVPRGITIIDDGPYK